MTMFNNEESTFSIIKVTMSVHLLINVALVFLKKTTKSQVRFSQCNVISLGPVVRTPVSANSGLNSNLGFFIFLSKALSRIIFSFLFRVSNHQIVGKEN